VRAKIYSEFTCTVCETINKKQFSRQAYEKGVVIIRCDGCQNLHLIADNLGWFGEEKNVEEILRKKGETVRRGLLPNEVFEKTEEGGEVEEADNVIFIAPTKEK